MPSAVHRDVTASGVRVRVTEYGFGEPLIVLHSTLANRNTFEPIAEHLQGFRLIAPDLPGFGESEKPSAQRFAYSVAAFTETITDLYGALELGRASVLGHGLGGAIALTLAAQRPELVSKLVLVNALCYSTSRDPSRRLASVPLFGNLIFKQLLGRGSFRLYFKQALLARHAHVPRERVDAYFEALNTPAARGSALATLRGTADTRSVIADLRRVQTPTLVIWGRGDRLFPAAQGRRLAREIPRAGFQLLDAGHLPHEETPTRFAEVVRRFLHDERPSDH